MSVVGILLLNHWD